jgi:hypothetical protein
MEPSKYHTRLSYWAITESVVLRPSKGIPEKENDWRKSAHSTDNIKHIRFLKEYCEH